MKKIKMNRTNYSVKKLFSFIAFIFLCSNVFSLTYNVTVPGGTKACYFAGEITGWSHQVMQKTDETHYTITFETATTTQQYKYCSGPGWAYVENTPNGNNRTYTANDVVTSWALIYDPAVTPTDVTYNVTVPTGTLTCYFAGGASNWSFQQMQKVDETHYRITINTATPNAYKYSSGPDWAYEELDANSSIVGNRNYTPADVVVKWRAVYNPDATGVTYNVTVPAGTNTCYIAGEMNNWSLTAMTKVDDTHYTLFVQQANTSQKYKYSSGPDWSYEELNADDSNVNNRSYAPSDVVAKWRSVYNPNPTGVNYNVTVPSGTKACFIAGEMNNWSLQPMSKVDETHFSLNITGTTTLQKYKYTSGPDWCFEELNADNTKVNDRSYAAADVVAKWSAVWNPDIAINQMSNGLKLSGGKVERYYFNKTSINNRAIDVWLPENYSTDKKYAVLYMQDGQMLFDGTQTWNNQEWKLDETLSELMTNGEIKDVIVVGIWNSSNRYAEYYPEKSLDYLPADIKTLKTTEMNNDPKADEYLSFIVNDLKPFIDKTYSVNTNQSNTYIGGSSMGGLISWYALCEYPAVFGGAICMSTHWANNELDSPSIPDSFRKYLLNKMPSPATHVVYFDHGTIGLDANYPQHQALTDTIMLYKGYTSENWKTQIFEGDDHNETCWANRFNVPARFILKKQTSTVINIDSILVNNKINVLNSHIRYHFSGQYTKYNYPLKKLTPEEYQTQKPSNNLPFDAGFVDSNGVINISEPTTTEQKALFADLTQVALYYVCQKYMYEFYNTKNLPLLLKVGFPVFEAGLLPSDATIKTAVNNYGGSLESFDVVNNSTTFLQKNGHYIAGVFGEFMNVYKNWAYQYILEPTSTGFNTASWWFNTETKNELLADFNRYLYARFLQPDENLRVKVCVETEHFKFYTNQKAANINFPFFSEVTEAAYNEYVNNFKEKAYEKISFFTMIGCEDGAIEGLACDPNGRLTGGTAWSSGVHTTSSPSTELLHYFYGQNRHELAHTFQGLIGQGVVTAWLNEGFPSFCAAGPITNEKLTENRQQGIDAMNNAIKYFGRRPTYEETRIYPSPDYGYYTMGYFFIDYQYRKGGYPLIKAIQKNDVAAYQSLGYATAQAFLDDFYFDFDVHIAQKPIVTLLNPVAANEETNSTVNINWLPQKTDAKLNVSVSVDDAKTWTEIVNRTSATSCIWNSGNISTRFYIKISAPDNLDISTTFGPFIKTDLTKLNITSPAVNNFVISGDTTSISWANTSVTSIKMDYTLNNGAEWTNISLNTPTSAKSVNWVVPTNIYGNCKIRLTDNSNSENSTVSETFTIVKPDEIGGPYLYDKNTLLLLHFDNDLNNRSKAAPNAVGNIVNLTGEASTVENLGWSYKNNSVLSVPHHANLNLAGDWTIEAWVKLTAYNANSNMYIFWKPGDTDAYQSNYSLEINPWWGNVFYGYYFSELNNRIGVTGNSPELNEWYHLAFIRDTNKKSIRLILHDKNRHQISSTESAYTPTATLINSKDLLIGTGLSGYIDEVRISNIVRNFVRTGIENAEQEKMYEIFPNPASGQIKIRNLAGNSNVKILSVDGKTLFNKNATSSEEETIDISGLAKGIYFIQVSKSGKIHTEKLIVE